MECQSSNKISTTQKAITRTSLALCLATLLALLPFAVQAEVPNIKLCRDGGGSSPSPLVIDSTLYFCGATQFGFGELWKSDGTEVVLVQGASSIRHFFPRGFTNVNGTLFFSANDGVNGQELWKSDGTESGTVMVRDIRNGSSSFPSDLVNINGTLFFTAVNTANRRGLWRSDGTSSGTVLVQDFRSVGSLFNFDGTLIFIADDGTHGSEIWKSDGTEAGTDILNLVGSGSSLRIFPGFFETNGTLFFRADDGVSGSELWRSDGTEAGTALVKDINSGSGNSNPLLLTKANGTVFFTAYDDVHGSQLWKSDGTEGGTVLLTTISQFFTSQAVSINGSLFFEANDGISGSELWKSDGTETGTSLVKDIQSGSSGSSPFQLTKVNDTLFFIANDGVHGLELWRSDGTEIGTTLVKDIQSGANDGLSPFQQFMISNGNGTLFFIADDGVSGSRLWKSDGTDSGTVIIGSSNSDPVVTSADTLHIVENTTAVQLLTATDADGDALTYTLTGGADKALFTLNTTGELSFLTAPVFATPTDADGDNLYEIEITAADGNGGKATQNLTISVVKAQIVTFNCADKVAAGNSFTCTLNYSTSDNNPNSIGLGFKLHYDSSKLTLGDFSDIFATSLIGQDGASQDDVNDLDGDPNTDKYINTAWASADQDWPGGNLPTTLYKVQFTLNSDAALDSTTALKLSSSTSNGQIYSFESVPHSITAAPAFSWDIDDNNDTSFTSDGVMVIRYLFGFRGDELVNGVVGDASNRDTAAIEQYLSDNLALLDIDGDGEAKPLTDGLLLIRYLAGFDGEILTNGAVNAAGTRTTAEEIEDYIKIFLEN